MIVGVYMELDNEELAIIKDALETYLWYIDNSLVPQDQNYLNELDSLKNKIKTIIYAIKKGTVYNEKAKD